MNQVVDIVGGVGPYLCDFKGYAYTILFNLFRLLMASEQEITQYIQILFLWFLLKLSQ